jgi:hypothetical protein
MLCCLAWSSAIAGDMAPDRTKHGEEDVVIEVVKTSDNVPGIKASFCVKSTPERIWSVLTGYHDFPKIYKGLNKTDVLVATNAGAKVGYRYSINFLGVFNREINMVLSDQYSASHRRIVWESVAGDIERLEGSWDILDTQQKGTCLLVYHSYAKAPWYVPASLVRFRVMNEVHDMVRAIRTWVEKKEA